MDEYIKKSDVIDWFSPYNHIDEPIPFETLAYDIRSMKPAADVAPVRHGRWILIETDEEQFFFCSECENKEYWESNFCPSCGAKMDGGETT